MIHPVDSLEFRDLLLAERKRREQRIQLFSGIQPCWWCKEYWATVAIFVLSGQPSSDAAPITIGCCRFCYDQVFEDALLRTPFRRVF